MECVWYFAYGRNLNVSKLVDRIGSKPILVSRGILPGYKLIFNKKPGPKEGAGYANIEPAPADWVEGALYLLTGQDLEKLDKHEGVPKHYKRTTVIVWAIDLKTWVNAISYRATETDNSLKPPKEYLQEIIEGARSLGLSDIWTKRLENLLEGAI